MKIRMLDSKVKQHKMMVSNPRLCQIPLASKLDLTGNAVEMNWVKNLLHRLHSTFFATKVTNSRTSPFFFQFFIMLITEWIEFLVFFSVSCGSRTNEAVGQSRSLRKTLCQRPPLCHHHHHHVFTAADQKQGYVQLDRPKENFKKSEGNLRGYKF